MRENQAPPRLFFPPLFEKSLSSSFALSNSTKSLMHMRYVARIVYRSKSLAANKSGETQRPRTRMEECWTYLPSCLCSLGCYVKSKVFTMTMPVI